MRQVPEKYKKKLSLPTNILPIYTGIIDINAYNKGAYGIRGNWKNVFTGISTFGEIGIEWKRLTKLNSIPSTSQILKRRDHTSHMFWNTWLENFRSILEDDKKGTADFFTTRPEERFSPKNYAESYMNDFSMPIHILDDKEKSIWFLNSLLSIVEEIIKGGKYNKNPLHPQHHFAVPKARWHDPTPECNFNKVNKWKYFIRVLKKYMEILNSYTD